MKKIVSMLLVTILTLSFAATFTGCQQISKPSNLLVLGDSIASGYGLPGYPETEKSYGSELAGALRLPSSSYTNLAVNGADSTDLYNTLTDMPPALKKANIIIISIGGNDLLKPFSADLRASLNLTDAPTQEVLAQKISSDPNAMYQFSNYWKDPQVQEQYTAAVQNFSQNFSEIIKMIRKDNPKARLFVQTLYNPLDGLAMDGLSADGMTGFEKLNAFADTYISQINQVIKSNSSKGKYTVLDIYSAFHQKASSLTNIMKLDVHPNQSGHDLIFQTAYKAITGKTYSPQSSQSGS